MLDAMQYTVDDEGEAHFHICLQDFGISVDLCVSLGHPNFVEWDAASVEAFQNDTNLLLEQARTDLHRLIRSTSRNTQLAAFGMTPEFSEDEDLQDEVPLVDA